MDYHLNEDNSSLEDILFELENEHNAKRYSLGTTINDGSYVDLGRISITGIDRISVQLNKEAESTFGASFGQEFGRIEGSRVDLPMTPLQLANILGFDVNNKSALEKISGTDYANISLFDIIELAQEHTTSIMITEGDRVDASQHFTSFSDSSIITTPASEAAVADFVLSQAKPQSTMVFIRNQHNELRRMDVIVSNEKLTTTSPSANDLAYHHAASEALRASGIPVPKTTLIKPSTDSNRTVLLKEREGEAPIIALRNADGKYQCKTHKLHQASGFCSMDKYRLIATGEMTQSRDAAAKLIAVSMKNPALLEKSLPVIIFNKVMSGDTMNGNNTGINLSIGPLGRRASQSLNTMFSSPSVNKDTLMSEMSEKNLYDMARIPCLAHTVTNQPDLSADAFNTSLSSLRLTFANLDKLVDRGLTTRDFYTEKLSSINDFNPIIKAASPFSKASDKIPPAIAQRATNLEQDQATSPTP